MRIVGYVRVSTEQQEIGPIAQRQALEKWASDNRCELIGIEEDCGVSGGLPPEERPGMVRAIAAINSGKAQAILVAKRDRLARDTYHAGSIEYMLQKAGARVLSADGNNADSPEGRAMRGMQDVFAQYERDIIRLRTKMALNIKKSRKERVGYIPFGFKLAEDEIHLEPNDSEMGVINTIRGLKTKGMSVRKIAQHLNDANVPARGSKWHATSIQRIWQTTEDHPA